MQQIRRFLMYITGMAELLTKIDAIEKRLVNLDKCITRSNKGYGDSYSVSTRHWND